jgi:hypothetical protein
MWLQDSLIISGSRTLASHMIMEARSIGATEVKDLPVTTVRKIMDSVF